MLLAHATTSVSDAKDHFTVWVLSALLPTSNCLTPTPTSLTPTLRVGVSSVALCVGSRHLNGNLPTIGHRLDAVGEEVQEDFRESLRVSVQEEGGRLRTIPILYQHLNSRVFKFRLKELKSFIEELIEINRYEIQLLRFGETKDTGDQMSESVSFTRENVLELVQESRIRFSLREMIGESLDRRERIPDLMNHRGGELTDGGEFLRVTELVLELFILADEFAMRVLEEMAIEPGLQPLLKRLEGEGNENSGDKSAGNRAIAQDGLELFFGDKYGQEVDNGDGTDEDGINESSLDDNGEIKKLVFENSVPEEEQCDKSKKW